MPGAGGEIIEDVLFVGQIAGEMPGLAVLAAAAEIGDDEDAATIKPEAMAEVKLRAQTDSVAAVTGEEDGIGAVELETPAMQNIQRDFRTVPRDGKLAHHLDIAEIDRRCVREGGLRDGETGVAWAGIAEEPGGRRGIAAFAEEKAIVIGAILEGDEAAHARIGGDWQVAALVAVEIEAPEPRWPAHEVRHIEPGAGQGQIFDDSVALGDSDLRLLHATRAVEWEPEDFPAGRILDRS